MTVGVTALPQSSTGWEFHWQLLTVLLPQVLTLNHRRRNLDSIPGLSFTDGKLVRDHVLVTAQGIPTGWTEALHRGCLFTQTLPLHYKTQPPHALQWDRCVDTTGVQTYKGLGQKKKKKKHARLANTLKPGPTFAAVIEQSKSNTCKCRFLIRNLKISYLKISFHSWKTLFFNLSAMSDKLSNTTYYSNQTSMIIFYHLTSIWKNILPPALPFLLQCCSAFKTRRWGTVCALGVMKFHNGKLK